MGKRKLSAMELKLKKMAVISEDRYAKKSDVMTVAQAESLFDSIFNSNN